YASCVSYFRQRILTSMDAGISDSLTSVNVILQNIPRSYPQWTLAPKFFLLGLLRLLQLFTSRGHVPEIPEVVCLFRACRSTAPRVLSRYSAAS
ncbi:hypothetical protein BgiBS90_005388, partial [Biomphalaria glabrata]